MTLGDTQNSVSVSLILLLNQGYFKEVKLRYGFTSLI